MTENKDSISDHARALSALGAKKGAKARAEALSPEERRDIATYAAQRRWLTNSRVIKETHAGILKVGNIPCSVLENETRVLSTRGVTRAFGGRQTGTPRGETTGAPQLPPFLASATIRPFISAELMARLMSPIEYRPIRGGRTAFGYEATLLADICRVVRSAQKGGKLRANQRKLADASEVLLDGLADVGIIALVDEATGYQVDRAKDELMKILEAYISKALLPWTRRFPDQLFKDLYRLHGWQFREGKQKGQGPRVVGRLVRKLVYEQLPDGVLPELERRNPSIVPGYRRHKHHQFLTEDTGHPHLNNQIAAVMTLMRASDEKHEFFRLFDRAFPKKNQQMALALPPGKKADEG